MQPQPIIDLTDPRLRQVSQVVDNFDADLSILVDQMIATMISAGGIGLAAVQIGVLKRVIVTYAAEIDGSKVVRALINPRIEYSSSDAVETNEGCLSIPGVRLAFSRPSNIIVKYQDIEGELLTLEANGMLATCIQHEIDHLDGILIVDHVSKLKRDRATAAFRKTRRFA